MRMTDAGTRVALSHGPIGDTGEWVARLRIGTVFRLGIGALVLALAGGCSAETIERDETGSITAEGEIDAFRIQAGDCFNDEALFAADTSTEVFTLPGVPCTDPHDNEVFAVFDVDMESFPGGDEISSLAFDQCLERFEAFVGRDYETSELDVMTLYPTAESWTVMDDRAIVCGVFRVDLEQMIGSMRESGI